MRRQKHSFSPVTRNENKQTRRYDAGQAASEERRPRLKDDLDGYPAKPLLSRGRN